MADEVRETQKRIDIPGRADDISLSTIGGRIAWSRLRKGITQAAFAKSIEKARATIVQYESNNITPPIDVITSMARPLGTTPEFLAFGRHGVDGAGSKEAIVSLQEMRLGRDGEFSSGGFVVPKAMMSDFGIDEDQLRHLKVYILPQETVNFGLGAKSRLIIDTSDQTMNSARHLYLLNTPSGLEVVRPEPSYTTADKLSVTSSTGQILQVLLKDLNVIGKVVGKISAA